MYSFKTAIYGFPQNKFEIRSNYHEVLYTWVYQKIAILIGVHFPQILKKSYF